MAIAESAEVRREKWLRGDLRWFSDKLPSKEWVKGKLPGGREEWLLAIYAGALIGVALIQIVKESIQRGKDKHVKSDA